MISLNQKTFFYALITLAVFTLTACAPQMQIPLQVCPGKTSTADALSTLTQHSDKMPKLTAYGRCRARFIAEDKSYNENFAVKLWLSPPDNIRLHGDIFFDARGLDLGSNKTEFWFSMRPKEISTYIFGSNANSANAGKLPINPALLLEAMGTITASDPTNWQLTNEDGLDVLTKTYEDLSYKKIYISNCDYRIAKIQYFDSAGQMLAAAELNKYKNVTEDFAMPTSVNIIRYTETSQPDSFKITLRSIKPTDFTPAKRNVLFTRPKPRRQKNVYQIIDGKITEQPKIEN